MSSPFVAEIRMFAGNFPPKGWAQCDGQLLPISQNTALFSLLGTFYGGDGRSTFALPNLQGSVPVGQGQGAGLSQRFVGESSGVSSVTLLSSEMPVHTHSAMGRSANNANNPSPAPDQSLSKAQGGFPYSNATANQTPMAVNAIGVAGGSLPHNNMSPYLCLTFIIAMQGVFPPRS